MNTASLTVKIDAGEAKRRIRLVTSLPEDFRQFLTEEVSLDALTKWILRGVKVS